MNQEDRWNLVDAMKKYGGSFVRALADCFTHADAENTEKLIQAFPEYVHTYSVIAKQLGQEKNENTKTIEDP